LENSKAKEQAPNPSNNNYSANYTNKKKIATTNRLNQNSHINPPSAPK